MKGIHQGGASYLVNSKWNITRYEHSIGTMLFIKFMGGSIEEQIAGLLHDISHTAFSHVIDFVFKNSDEDYHEKIFKDIIEASTIPKILTDNGYDYKDILFNESKWTILEKSAPKLCADRVDYTLRDMLRYGFITMGEVKTFLKNLSVVQGEVVLNSVKASEWFVEVYYKEVIGFFMDPLNVYAYDRLSKALEIAVGLKEVTLDDLLKKDEEVYRKLENSSSKEVRDLINSIHSLVNLEENREEYDIFSKSKVRLIDPTVCIDGQLYKASEISDIVKELNERALRKAEDGVYIKIV